MKRLMFVRTLTAGAMLGALTLSAGAFAPAGASESIPPPFVDANAPGTSVGKSSASIKAFSSYSLIATTFSGGDGTFGVYLMSGENPCGGNGFWGFDGTAPAGKVMMAQLLAARAMGKRVQLHCGGTFYSWNNITALYVE